MPPDNESDIPVGALVRDPASGFTGILCDLCPYADPAQPRHKRSARLTAFVRPVGGGVEYALPPDGIETVCRHQDPVLETAEDGQHCPSCGVLIYAATIPPPHGRTEA